MRLNEIKNVVDGEYDLSEGVIPVHLTMTLEQVIRDGKVTNPVQYFIMGALVEMFKNGGVTRWPRDLNAYSMTTSSELIESLKALSEKEHVNMATWLMNQLQGPVNFETNPYAMPNPQMNPVEWMKLVLHHQN